MSSELDLLVELNNPLYLFPIIGVVVTALLVYAFGFKSSTQPSNEVFDALNDDKHHKSYKTHETIKKRKNNIKITSNKSEPKSEPNGHITSGTVKVLDKKTPKKAVVESKPTSSSSNTNTKSNAKKDKKNKKSEDVVDREDMDSGEWVELISKKERKNRKQKEEQLLIDSNESQTNKSLNKKSEKSPKKSKENKKTLDSNVSSDTKQIEKTVKLENIKNVIKTEIEVNNSEELLAEEPDIYELAKEQRAPKKMHKNRNQKRSESEVTSRVEAKDEIEPKANLDVSDKLTAAIVANYEASDHNKPDSLSTANNKKKKEKNKKKQTQTQQNNEIIDKQVIKTDQNISVAVIETPVEKSEITVNTVDIPNELKPSEDDDFKSVSKKRRARRE